MGFVLVKETVDRRLLDHLIEGKRIEMSSISDPDYKPTRADIYALAITSLIEQAKGEGLIVTDGGLIDLGYVVVREPTCEDCGEPGDRIRVLPTLPSPQDCQYHEKNR